MTKPEFALWLRRFRTGCWMVFGVATLVFAVTSFMEMTVANSPQEPSTPPGPPESYRWFMVMLLACICATFARLGLTWLTRPDDVEDR
ncbi:MAG: hypothetical protein AOY29_02920 [Alcanivorax borkumensis]|nr:MAG: hypothetical protein AOY29_02920 [Alcanivorax borkumensis]